MIASSAHRIGTRDARRYLKCSLANGAPLAMQLLLTSDNGIIRPCSGLDNKKSWQGDDNDEEHAISHRLITESPFSQGCVSRRQ